MIKMLVPVKPITIATMEHTSQKTVPLMMPNPAVFLAIMKPVATNVDTMLAAKMIIESSKNGLSTILA